MAALKDGLETIEKFKGIAKTLGNLGNALGAAGAVIGFLSFLAEGGVDPVMAKLDAISDQIDSVQTTMN